MPWDWEVTCYNYGPASEPKAISEPAYRSEKLPGWWVVLVIVLEVARRCGCSHVVDLGVPCERELWLAYRVVTGTD